MSVKNDFSKLRERAEKRLKHKGTSGNEHELNVHKEELEMQADELRSTQERLLHSLEDYTQLFNLVPVSYFVLDKKGNILNLNKAAMNLIGLGFNESKGKSFSLVLNGKSHQDDHYRYRNMLSETDAPQRIESEILRPDGKILSVLIESTVVKNEKKEFKHLLSTVVDISAQKETERKLEQALIQERELNEMKSRFVTMASHEFRTPLAMLQSSSDIIAMNIRSNKTADHEKHFKRIKVAITNLTGILDDFLSLDKLEHGGIETKKEKMNISKFIADIVTDVRLSIKQGQTIEYIYEGKDEFVADQKILRSILINLLTNASKYSAEGKQIELVIKVSKNKLTISVKDQGIGIPSNEQGKIFTNLFRAKNAEMVGGTGLGLNIIKKYIELLNGKISFTSKENIGSTFIVEIPE